MSRRLVAFAIVGGEPIPSLKYGQSHPGSYNTVALLKESIPGALRVFCTGSIIGLDLILTAKHCVNDKKASEVRVFFGVTQDNIDPSLLSEVENIHEFGPGHNWKDFFPNKDLAVIKIKGQIPSGFRPLEILRDPKKLVNGSEVTIVGYGNTVASAFEIKAGTKLKADLSLKEYIHNAHFYYLLLLQGQNGQGACHGDSGGPAYVFLGNRWYIIGVTNGFDLTLTPETIVETGDDLFPLRAHCDKGQVLYSFAGVHWQWVQKVSGSEVIWSVDNTVAEVEPVFPQDRLKSFADWCERVDHENPDWLTVKQLMLEAIKYKNKNQETDRDIFFNCQRAEQILSNRLEKKEELSFDKDSFFTGLAPLASLKNLKRLRITDRDLSRFDFTPLLNAESLAELSLVRSKIQNLESLTVLKTHGRLKSLGVEEGEIFDITPLRDWPSLESINLQRQKISDIQTLSGLKNLKNLNLASNRIADVKVVSELAALESLNLGYNPILRLPPMQGLTSLQELMLEHTQIREITPLRGLGLRILNLDAAKIGDLQSISEMVTLKTLRANDTAISSIAFIARLGLLENLELAGNAVEKIEGITPGSHMKLQRMVLAGNNLSDLSALAFLPETAVLWLNGNPITNGQVPKTAENCPQTQGPSRLQQICQPMR